eukprot:TRINITY_DN8318_c0_g1_i2.p1 TRINITY_DN8318_c0_g1~~TRINITY_DN8318_c0_g1_i2.p1  ORF type:complete len:350 (-),score=23.93 TRINITY_DN8318_c0_g1_i2:472-1497(-)
MSVSWKKKQVRGILDLISENQQFILRALQSDLGKHPLEAFRDEVALTVKSATISLKNLHSWARSAEYPRGMVLVISSWTYPFNSAMDPIIAAISAGNTVVLKPAEEAAETSKLLARLIPRYVEVNAVKVANSSTDIILRQRWDHIFVAGGTPSIAEHVSHVITAAAKHPTAVPVTVEFGGTCPVVVDVSSLSIHELLVHSPFSSLRVSVEIHYYIPTHVISFFFGLKTTGFNFDVNGFEVRRISVYLQTSTRRIALGKWGSNNGQSCHAPDYILVEERFAENLLAALKVAMESFKGKDEMGNGYLCKIINRHHFTRLLKLMEDPSVSQCVAYGGRHDEHNL